MSGSEKSVAQQLLEACFPGVVDPDLQGCIESLLCCIHAEQRVFEHGPVTRVLLTGQMTPSATGRRNWRGGRATARLHLADGTLYELHLSGNISSFLKYLPQLGAWLAEFGVSTSPDATLTALASGTGEGPSACRVSVPRYASIAPRPLVSDGMALRMALGNLNLLRREHGLEPFQDTPPLLSEYMAATHSQTGRTIDAYLSSLNRDILPIIEAFRSRYHPRYDDLKVYNFLNSGRGQVSRNRRQAIHELPWLLRILSGLDAMFSLDNDDAFASRRTDPEAVADITAAIDAGRPLFSAVARALGVPVETVKWTRHQMLPLYSGFAVPRMDVLLRILSWLAPEKRPRSDTEWRQLQSVMSTLFCLAGAVRDERNRLSGPEMVRQDGPVVAAWLRELTRPTLAAACDRFDRMCRTGDDPENAMDFLRALRRSFRRFCHATGEEPDCAAMLQAWLARQSFFRLMSLSRRWHAEMHAHLMRNGPVNPNAERIGNLIWPKVLHNVLHVGSVSISELPDSRSLEEEGRSMEHCVAGYSQKCAMENAIIVSIRDVAGFRLSTAELAIRDAPLTVVLVQHKGRRNRPPPDNCVSPVTFLVQLLNHPRYSERLAARREFQKTSKRHHEAMLERIPDSIENYRRAEEHAAWQLAKPSSMTLSVESGEP